MLDFDDKNNYFLLKRKNIYTSFQTCERQQIVFLKFFFMNLQYLYSLINASNLFFINQSLNLYI